MASHTPRLSGKPHHLSIIAIGFLLPVVYSASYYANLEQRHDGYFIRCGINIPGKPDADLNPPIPDFYDHEYRLFQNQSEVIFWPAECVDGAIRP